MDIPSLTNILSEYRPFRQYRPVFPLLSLSSVAFWPASLQAPTIVLTLSSWSSPSPFSGLLTKAFNEWRSDVSSGSSCMICQVDCRLLGRALLRMRINYPELPRLHQGASAASIRQSGH